MEQTWSDPLRVLAVVERVLSAPRPEILSRFSREVAGLLPHRAAAMQTADCARVPVKATGEQSVTAAITSAELLQLAERTPPGEGLFLREIAGGEKRPLVTVSAAPAFGNGALLVLVLPDDNPPGRAELEVVVRLWNVLSVDAAQRAAQPEPDLLASNLAAATARSHAITDLGQTHATTLTTLLSVLRSRQLPDDSARRTAIDLATTALLDLRAVAERHQELSAQPAEAAFAELAGQLSMLVRHGDVAVELAGPDSDRSLARDLAHTARTVTRGLVLAALARRGTTRLRASWRIDPAHLRITVRDNGPDADGEPAGPGITERIEPIRGHFEVDAVPGWGTTVTAVLPLGVAEPPAARPLDRLHARELEVLAGITRGLRNRQIAGELQLSEHTVKFHVRNILDKLDVTSRGEAAALARELRLDRPA
jgi:DNA-binding CsgD family transcriptional regulator